MTWGWAVRCNLPATVEYIKDEATWEVVRDYPDAATVLWVLVRDMYAGPVRSSSDSP
jgi:hypothetical protein